MQKYNWHCFLTYKNKSIFYRFSFREDSSYCSKSVWFVFIIKRGVILWALLTFNSFHCCNLANVPRLLWLTKTSQAQITAALILQLVTSNMWLIGAVEMPGSVIMCDLCKVRNWNSCLMWPVSVSWCHAATLTKLTS